MACFEGMARRRHVEQSWPSLTARLGRSWAAIVESVPYPQLPLNMSTSSPPDPAAQYLEQVMQKTGDFVRKEPVKALAVAFGAGLLARLLPTRSIASAVSRLVPPALLGLGAMKVLELYKVGEEAARPHTTEAE